MILFYKKGCRQYRGVRPERARKMGERTSRLEVERALFSLSNLVLSLSFFSFFFRESDPRQTATARDIH